MHGIWHKNLLRPAMVGALLIWSAITTQNKPQAVAEEHPSLRAKESITYGANSELLGNSLETLENIPEPLKKEKEVLEASAMASVVPGAALAGASARALRAVSRRWMSWATGAALLGGYAASRMLWPLRGSQQEYGLLQSSTLTHEEGGLLGLSAAQKTHREDQSTGSMGSGPRIFLPPGDLLEEEEEHFLSHGIEQGSLGITLEQGDQRRLYVDGVLRQGAAHRYRALQVGDELLAVKIDSGPWFDLSQLALYDIEALLWAPFSSTFHIKLRRPADILEQGSSWLSSPVEEPILEVAVPSSPLHYKNSHFQRGDVLAVLEFFIKYHVEGGSLQEVLSPEFISFLSKGYLAHWADHKLHVTDDVLHETALKVRMPDLEAVTALTFEQREVILGNYLLQLIDVFSHDITDLYVGEVWQYYSFVRQTLEDKRQRNLSLKELKFWSEEPGEYQQLRQKLYKMALHLSDKSSSALSAEDLAQLLLKYAHIEAREALALTQHSTYTTFLKAFARSLDIHTYLLDATEISGISSQDWGITLEERAHYMLVQHVNPRSLASRSGLLRQKDRIKALRLPGSDVWRRSRDITLPEMKKILASQNVSRVQLKVQRGHQNPPEGELAEDIITLDRWQRQIQDRRLVPAYTWQVPYAHTNHSARVAHLVIPGFFENAADGKGVAEHIAQSLQQLSEQEGGIHALLLDLRDNLGGEIGEVLKVAHLFMRPKHMILQQPITVDQSTFSTEDLGEGVGGLSSKVQLADFLHLPVVVLVNATSVSGSELLAQAFQVHGRGIVVGGPHTYGKGTFTVVNDLQHAGQPLAIRLSAGRYFGADGSSVQLKGVAADVVIPSLTSLLASREKDHSPVVSHKTLPFDLSASYGLRQPKVLEELRMRSQERISQSDVLSSWQRISHAEKGDQIHQIQQLSHMPQLQSLIKSKMMNRRTYDKFFASSGRVLSEEMVREKAQSDAVLTEALQVVVDYLELIEEQR